MAPVGHVVRDMLVKLGATDYAVAVTGVTENHNVATQTSQTAVTDGTITDIGADEATIGITFNTDSAANSLWSILTETAVGTAIVVKWTPDPVNATRVRTANCKVLPPNVDHTVGNFGSASVELPVTGAITWTTS
jgi:hypothetical protein